MEKFSLTNLNGKIKVFGNLLKSSDTRKQNSSSYQNNEFFVWILICLIALPELLIYFGKFGEAILTYAGILIALSLISIFVKNKEIRNICQVFLLLPILRLVNFSVPLFSEIPLLSFVFFYTPMFIPLSIIITDQRLSPSNLGLISKNIVYYIPLSILIGLILGQIEYSLVQTIEFIPEFSFANILIFLFIMIFPVALVEELLFRSILQTTLEETFGLRNGLVFASLIFGFMNSGYGSLHEIFFAICVGLVIGFIFQKTRSLPFIVMIHALTNVFSFGIIPFLGHGLGLF